MVVLLRLSRATCHPTFMTVSGFIGRRADDVAVLLFPVVVEIAITSSSKGLEVLAKCEFSTS